METVIRSQAEGWIVAQNVTVTPQDAQPGQTIHIRASFKNQASWLPAYGVLQLKLDGIVIDNYGDGILPTIFVPGEVVQWDYDYVLPASISSGIPHRIQALEQGQANIPYVDFTVTSAPPPGQRNISFTSVPAGSQIYIGNVYYGNTPITIPLNAGVYAVRGVYSGQEVSRNIQVTTGAGTMSVQFSFTQETPFDFTKWLSDNQYYIGAGIIGLGVLYYAIKKPDSVKRAVSKGYEAAKKTVGI